MRDQAEDFRAGFALGMNTHSRLETLMRLNPQVSPSVLVHKLIEQTCAGELFGHVRHDATSPLAAHAWKHWRAAEQLSGRSLVLPDSEGETKT